VSETVTIKKEVEVDATVKAEIEVQVDHVECTGCGKELTFTAESDPFGDIQIAVEPHNCEDK